MFKQIVITTSLLISGCASLGGPNDKPPEDRRTKQARSVTDLLNRNPQSIEHAARIGNEIIFQYANRLRSAQKRRRNINIALWIGRTATTLASGLDASTDAIFAVSASTQAIAGLDPIINTGGVAAPGTAIARTQCIVRAGLSGRNEEIDSNVAELRMYLNNRETARKSVASSTLQNDNIDQLKQALAGNKQVQIDRDNANRTGPTDDDIENYRNTLNRYDAIPNHMIRNFADAYANYLTARTAALLDLSSLPPAPSTTAQQGQSGDTPTDSSETGRAEDGTDTTRKDGDETRFVDLLTDSLSDRKAELDNARLQVNSTVDRVLVALQDCG